MKRPNSILKQRVNVWIFLGLTIALRFASDAARYPVIPATLPGLQNALREDPDAFVWHDLLSDQYFQAGELKRSLFHRREALRILEQEEIALQEIAELGGGSGEDG